MPENRNKNGKFVPGNCANPGGRPKLPEEFKKIARENSVPALQAMVDMLNSPNTSDRDRAKAAEIIMDRAWGKATQPISGDEDMPPAFVNMTDEDIVKRLVALGYDVELPKR